MNAEPVASGSTNPNLGLMLAAMGDQFSTRVKKALSVYVAAGTVATVSRRAWDRARSEVTYTVTVDSTDELYEDVHAWVLARVPRKRQRSLVARSRRADVVAPVAALDRVPDRERSLRVFYDGRRTQAVQVGTHRIRVSVEQEEIGRGQRETWGTWRHDRVVFTVYGVAARDAVLDVLAEMAQARNARPDVRVFGPGWGEWQRMAEVPPRPLDTVILRDGQREDLQADLDGFLAAEQTYTRLGLPWHRGYLFTGPPGTGKTSLAKALAQYRCLDVYFLPLSGVPNDGALSRLLSTVPPRSMLLIEDVDIAHGARKRDDSEPGVTLSGLLNGLDGVMTPHGLVTVLTTNDDTVVDPALLRAGRVDRTYHLGYVDDDQLERLVTFALGEPLASIPSLECLEVTPARVIEALKPNLGDPAGARRALVALAVGGDGTGPTLVPLAEQVRATARDQGWGRAW